MHMQAGVKYFAQASVCGGTPENELGILRHAGNNTEAALAQQLGAMTETDV